MPGILASYEAVARTRRTAGTGRSKSRRNERVWEMWRGCQRTRTRARAACFRARRPIGHAVRMPRTPAGNSCAANDANSARSEGDRRVSGVIRRDLERARKVMVSAVSGTSPNKHARVSRIGLQDILTTGHLDAASGSFVTAPGSIQQCSRSVTVRFPVCIEVLRLYLRARTTTNAAMCALGLPPRFVQIWMVLHSPLWPTGARAPGPCKYILFEEMLHRNSEGKQSGTCSWIS